MLYAEDFRRIARNALNGRWALAIGTGLVATLLGGGTGSYNPPNTGWRNNFDSYHINWHVVFPFMFGLIMILLAYALILFFIGGAVTLGYCRFNRNLIDNNNPGFGDIFSRFDLFWKGFVMQLLIFIYIFLWALLFIIPGIIASFSYAMTPYILEENPGMSANEAIRYSKEMMQGNKWRLFCLNISFIGWAILSLLTCGIGYLWLIPYQSAAHAAFFYEVSGKYASQNGYSEETNGINNMHLY